MWLCHTTKQFRIGFGQAVKDSLSGLSIDAMSTGGPVFTYFFSSDVEDALRGSILEAGLHSLDVTG